MPDFIPVADGRFKAWAANFTAYLNGHASEVGLLPADLLDLQTAAAAWEAAYPAALTARAQAAAAAQNKKAARRAHERAIRALARRLQASPALTDAQRQALGITVRDKTPTRTSARAAATRPHAIIDTSQRFRHTIAFFDESTPTSRAKPAGVLGCEILVKIGGAPPADPRECQFLTLDTASPYIAVYESQDANQMAHYLLRWVTRGGAKGPWSETVSATIVG